MIYICLCINKKNQTCKKLENKLRARLENKVNQNKLKAI